MKSLILLAGLAFATVKNPDILNYAIMGDVDSLDPAWIYDGISHEIQLQVYENLITYKGASTEKFEPVLASKLPTISKDGLTYTFPIRKGVKFHDGTPLTAEDARYSVLRFLLMDRASGPSLLLLEPILGYESTADEKGQVRPGIYQEAVKAVQVKGDSLVLKLKKPCAPLLSILAVFSPIVSKSFVAAHGGWDGTEGAWLKHRNPLKEATGLFDTANGTGPFAVERWDKQNKHVILKRWDGYWRKPASLARVAFKTVPEFSTRKLLLSGGDADAVLMERQFLPQVSDVAGVQVQDDLPFLETHNCFIMQFNVNPVANPYLGSGKLDGKGIPANFFSDKDVRVGFAHAFDYDGYIRDGYRGKGRRARGPIPFGLLGHNPKQKVREHDMKKAEEHLRKAWGGQAWEKGFHMTLTFMEGRTDRQLACQILKAKIEALNPKFRVDVKPILWSTFLRDLQAGKLPIVNARWALDFADPHNAVHAFLHSQGNYGKVQGYNNPKADALIEAAWKEGNLEKRKKLYHQLQEIAYEDLPTIFTLDTYNFLVQRDWVKGWTYNPVMMYGYLYPVSKAAP